MEENVPLWRQLEKQGIKYPAGNESPQPLSDSSPIKKEKSEAFTTVRIRKDTLPDLHRLISLYHIKFGVQTNLADIVKALTELGFSVWKQ